VTALQEKPKAVAPQGPPPRRRGKRATALAGTDKLVLGLMLGIPTFVHVLFVWIPTLGSIALSFSRWNGIGGFEDIEWIGVGNYVEIFTEYPRFWPAVQHNLIWLAFLLIVPTCAGLLLAVLLDREIKGSRIYQSALYMPMVLSLALIGFIWQLIYTPDGGLLNSVLGLNDKPSTGSATPTSTSTPCSSRRRGGTPATSCCCTWRA
jgi:multiple sugar transport system permease protein